MEVQRAGSLQYLEKGVLDTIADWKHLSIWWIAHNAHKASFVCSQADASSHVVTCVIESTHYNAQHGTAKVYQPRPFGECKLYGASLWTRSVVRSFSSESLSRHSFWTVFVGLIRKLCENKKEWVKWNSLCCPQIKKRVHFTFSAMWGRQCVFDTHANFWLWTVTHRRL